MTIQDFTIGDKFYSPRHDLIHTIIDFDETIFSEHGGGVQLQGDGVAKLVHWESMSEIDNGLWSGRYTMRTPGTREPNEDFKRSGGMR